MDQPIAFKLKHESATVHCVSFDAAVVSQLSRCTGSDSPAVVIACGAKILSDLGAGMIDAPDVIAVVDGDWDRAIMVLVPHTSEPEQQARPIMGDELFLAHVRRNAPNLEHLAIYTLEAIRSAGVDGELVESGQGKWVNRPMNSFTLKAQPRKGDLHFTIYGNPGSFDAPDFVKQDQNSYSRGWVSTQAEAHLLAKLVKQSHARRKQ